MAIFVVFICGLVQVLFISLVVNVQFFNSHFPVTTLGLDLFSGKDLQKLQFLWCPVIEKSKKSTILGASLPENGNRASLIR